MSNMNKGISSKCDGSQERPTKHTHTLTSYFGGKNQEATSSQVHLQDSQPLPLPVPLAPIEDVDEPDIFDHDELEENIEANTQSSQDLGVNSQNSQNNIKDLDDNSKGKDGDTDCAQPGKGKRVYNAKTGAKSKKAKYRLWDISVRNFQIDWASKYPFIELVHNPKEGEPLVECRCMICTRINKKEKRLQLKIDTIEKHMGKVYEKKIIDGVENSVIR